MTPFHRPRQLVVQTSEVSKDSEVFRTRLSRVADGTIVEAIPVSHCKDSLTLPRGLVMSWKPFKFMRPATRRPIRRSSILRLEMLEWRLAPSSTNVLTFHNDIASTGLNSTETVLAPIDVQVGTFDRLFTTIMDG